MDLSKTALVVVDMQYGDAHRDYGLLKTKRENGEIERVEAYARRLDEVVIPNIQRLLTLFRSAGGEVVFIRIQSLTQDGRDRGAGHREKGIHFPPGSKEAEILDEIRPLDDELVFSKTCGSAFEGTPLDYVLRNMDRSRVVVVGVVTGSCVQATALGALERGFSTVVVEDATATWDDSMQRTAIETMRDRGAVIAAIAELAPLQPALRR
jgi:nicotinamidase-related amidase